MTSRPDDALQRARLLDAEMQLQRSWLELNLRELQAASASSPWARLKALKLGAAGLSLFRHRSWWLAGISLLINMYRRQAKKERA